MFRALAVFLGPTLLLLLLELALRLLAVGHPTAFLLPFNKDGVQYLVQNNRFGWTFFGRQMARSPHPIFIHRDKPKGTIRVFVFGESAAFGDPQPAFGLPRMLQAMLEARHPGTRFEVVNAAMTGINSHVILPIARDCARAGGDIWVLYIGNNEVVGPYGAGTVFGGQSLPVPLVRAGIWLKSTRLGQCLGQLASKDRSDSEWGGMLMFLNHQVPADDPRMDGVYRGFRRNLQDVIQAGHRTGAGIVVSTIAVNLKDCPPFASKHRAGLPASDLDKWTALRDQALKQRAEGDLSGEAQTCAAAARVDDRYAELRYLIGRSADGLGDAAQANEELATARDLDTLRFRCDSRLNGLIRETVSGCGSDRVVLADSERELAANSPGKIPGKEFFYDHVHLTFEGNYLVARTIAAPVERLLPNTGSARAPAGVSSSAQAPPWPTLAQCAQRLGWSDFSRRAALLEMVARLLDPPFSGQLGHDAQLAALRQHIAELSPAAGPAAASNALQQCEAALSSHADEPDLCLQAAVLAEAAGQTNRASALARRAVESNPLNAEALSRLGLALEQEQKLEDSAAALRRVVALDPDAFYGWYALGRVLGKLGQPEPAMAAYRQALRAKPKFGPGWLSLGELLAASGKKEQAESCFSQALTNRIRSAAELSRLAAFCQQRGWVLAAATNYAEAAELNPAEVSAVMRAGQNFSALGRRQDALRFFTAAVQLAPDSAPAHFLYGRELGQQGQASAAEEQFREAVRLMPSLAEARLNLALALANQGRLADAIAQYEAVLDRWPTNQVAQRNVERLRAALQREPAK